jgi:hypothetical protein
MNTYLAPNHVTKYMLIKYSKQFRFSLSNHPVFSSFDLLLAGLWVMICFRFLLVFLLRSCLALADDRYWVCSKSRGRSCSPSRAQWSQLRTTYHLSIFAAKVARRLANHYEYFFWRRVEAWLPYCRPEVGFNERTGENANDDFQLSYETVFAVRLTE